MKKVFLVKRDNPRRKEVAARAAEHILNQAEAGEEMVIEIDEPKRTLPQNNRMWAMLTDVADQVGWKRARWRNDRCIEDGRYIRFDMHPTAARLSPEEFKDVLTAALKRPRLFGSIDGGGIVAVGLRTSKMPKKDMTQLIELIFQFGAEHDVEWSEKAKEIW